MPRKGLDMVDVGSISNVIASRLYASLPCGLTQFAIVGDGFLVHDINDACWQICGYPNRETFMDAVRDSPDAIVFPDDRPAFSRLIQAAIDTEERQSADIRIVRYDGSMGYAHSILEHATSPGGTDVIQDVFVDTTAEIARLHEEQERNEETQELFHAALENSDVFFWEYDLETKVCTNGFKSVEGLGMPATIEDYPESTLETGFVAPEMKEAYRDLHARMRAGDFTNLDMDGKTVADDGTTSWRHIHYIPLPNGPDGHRRMFGISTPLDDFVISKAMGESLVTNGFDYLAMGDLSTGILTIYLDSIEGIDSSPVTEKDGISYLERYVRTYVVDEDQPEQLMLMDYASLLSIVPGSEPTKLYCRMYDTAGRTRTKRVIVSRTRGYGEALLITRIDVTEAVRKEQEDNERLRSTLEDLRKANDARGDFLSHMSHEMRTPLNGVIGTLDLMGDATPEEMEKYRTMALLSARHLANILNDILDMSKIDSGTLSLSPTHTNMQELAEFVRGVIDPMAREADVDFELTVVGDAGPAAFLDEGRLRQALLNLLTNAVKNTPPKGKVILGFDGTMIDGNTVRATFSVRDTGIGMSKEFLKHAFEPFVQAEGSNSKKGTGLGLPITNSIVAMMGGRLEVESEPGKGSRFWFTLTFPTHDPKLAPGKEREVAAGEYCRLGNYRGKRALVIDDNPINLIIAEKQFESFDLEVETATSGEEAVDRFMSSDPDHFDIIFMDVMMPGIDGYEATARIKASGRPDANLPIVAMTANAFAQDAEQSRRAGMAGHLPKPFSRNDVAELLNRLL